MRYYTIVYFEFMVCTPCWRPGRRPACAGARKGTRRLTTTIACKPTAFVVVLASDGILDDLKDVLPFTHHHILILPIANSSRELRRVTRNAAMFGRLVHYAVDAVLISTVVAGVRRSSGFGYVVI